jgi:DNA-directed RNA polymerase specialized sigma24 family protein
VWGHDEFDAFFRAEFPPLVAFLCKAGFEVEAARDVAAEAMLHALEAWPVAGDPRAWVRRVVGQLLDAAGDARADWSLGGDPRDDEELAALVEKHSGLIDLLASLPGRQRMVLAWSLDGFTPAQIAEALRITPSTVRSTLRHVRERLGRQQGARPGGHRDRER